MKILSRMLSKKIEPEENVGNLDLENDPLARLDRPVADDSGQVNSAGAGDDPLFADPAKPIKQKAEEPEVAGSGWASSNDWDDDDWEDDDEEDWGEEDETTLRQQTEDKEMLVSEIREAMGSVKPARPRSLQVKTPRPHSQPASEGDDWAQDESAGRQARARSQLAGFDGDSEDRLMEKTETVMGEQETSRRRSAMAHLKAAAAATKADRVLSQTVAQDTTADPEEQSPYRDDLAKVVRPHSVGRPISRTVSRPASAPAVWDQGEADEDAALFAAAEEGAQDETARITEELDAAEAERVARAPTALSKSDFADEDTAFGSDDDESDFGEEFVEESTMKNDEFPASPFNEEDEAENAFGTMSDDDFQDDNAPRPSSAVSEAVAFANAPDEPEVPEESEVRKKIWEMADEVAEEVEQARGPEAAPLDQFGASGGDPFVQVAPAVTGRAGRSAGRVKTRLLGFQADDNGPKDVFEEAKKEASGVAVPSQFPAGWIVVITGPGRGSCFTLHAGVSQIGRGEEQAVRLDFGDTSISRNNHAAVAYDDEQGKFFLGHGGKSNLVRLNGMPVLSTEEMTNGDEIRIGETTLKFVAMCGEEFTWAGQGDDASDE